MNLDILCINFKSGETVSRRINQTTNTRNAPTLQYEKPERPITDVSADDDVGITSEETGKPGTAEDPNGSGPTPP
jgi:hypothetical protein